MTGWRVAEALAESKAGYAWKITRDHISEDAYDDTGVTGPANASAAHLALLKDGEGVTFKMYDDDGILYYTGRLVFDPELEGDEDVTAGPLIDFGRPNAGAVRITYPRRPEWEVYSG